MKILQVIARVNRGGTAVWLENLILGLRANGFECILAAGHVQGSEIEDECFANLNGVRIKSMGRDLSIFGDIRSFLQVRSLIVELKPDVLNSHTAKAGVIARVASISIPKRNRPAIVHTYHGHLLYGYFPTWKVKIYIAIERILAARTNRLIAAGVKVRNELLQVKVGNINKYSIINPGVRKIKGIDRKLLRADIGLGDNHIVVGWLGRFTPVKRPEYFLELAKHFPEVTFIMGGDGELFSKISNAMSSNVLLLGWTTPEKIWGLSDIAVLTSKNEAQPISLVEAQFLSLPIVSFDVGSVSEIVEHGVSGYLVDDFSSLKIYIEKLLESKELRLSFGSAGQKHALANHGISNFISKHIETYKNAGHGS